MLCAQTWFQFFCSGMRQRETILAHFNRDSCLVSRMASHTVASAECLAKVKLKHFVKNGKISSLFNLANYQEYFIFINKTIFALRIIRIFENFSGSGAVVMRGLDCDKPRCTLLRVCKMNLNEKRLTWMARQWSGFPFFSDVCCVEHESTHMMSVRRFSTQKDAECAKEKASLRGLLKHLPKIATASYGAAESPIGSMSITK